MKCQVFNGAYKNKAHRRDLLRAVTDHYNVVPTHSQSPVSYAQCRNISGEENQHTRSENQIVLIRGGLFVSRATKLLQVEVRSRTRTNA